MSQQINLYQEQFRAARKRLGARDLALALGLFVLLLAGLSVHAHWRATVAESRVETAQARQQALQERVASLGGRIEAERRARPDSDLQQARAELAAKQRLLEYLDAGPLAERTGFSAHVEGLARRVVDDLWLSALRIRDGGERLHLEGHALAADRIPALITGLGSEPAYAGHIFRTLAIDRPDDADWRVDFTLASEPEPVSSAARGQR